MLDQSIESGPSTKDRRTPKWDLPVCRLCATLKRLVLCTRCCGVDSLIRFGKANEIGQAEEIGGHDVREPVLAEINARRANQGDEEQGDSDGKRASNAGPELGRSKIGEEAVETDIMGHGAAGKAIVRQQAAANRSKWMAGA